MPQMNPIKWTNIFILSILSLYLIMSKLFFNNKKINFCSNFIYKKNKMKKIILW